MTVPFRLAALGMLGLVALAPRVAPAAEFTDAQRAEIVSILREALVKDPTIIRDAIEALRADETAREQAAAKNAIKNAREHLVAAGDPIGGNPNGDVTIVEFFDVRCGYCKRLEPAMHAMLQRDRNVKVVYKDLPILGPASVLGAKAIMAAQKQNGYEKLREALMKGSPEITMATLQADAKKLGLDWAKLSKDMEDPAIQDRINANLALAQMLGIQGTPAMVIGEDLIPGAVGTEELMRAVMDARAKKG